MTLDVLLVGGLLLGVGAGLGVSHRRRSLSLDRFAGMDAAAEAMSGSVPVHPAGPLSGARQRACQVADTRCATGSA